MRMPNDLYCCEMSEACGTDRGEEKWYRVVVGRAKGCRSLGRHSVDGRIILKCKLKE
jgi:hypothetical protein